MGHTLLGNLSRRARWGAALAAGVVTVGSVAAVAAVPSFRHTVTSVLSAGHSVKDAAVSDVTSAANQTPAHLGRAPIGVPDVKVPAMPPAVQDALARIAADRAGVESPIATLFNQLDAAATAEEQAQVRQVDSDVAPVQAAVQDAKARAEQQYLALSLLSHSNLPTSDAPINGITVPSVAELQARLDAARAEVQRQADAAAAQVAAAKGDAEQQAQAALDQWRSASAAARAEASRQLSGLQLQFDQKAASIDSLTASGRAALTQLLRDAEVQFLAVGPPSMKQFHSAFDTFDRNMRAISDKESALMASVRSNIATALAGAAVQFDSARAVLEARLSPITGTKRVPSVHDVLAQVGLAH
jgi:hypothetical protein